MSFSDFTPEELWALADFCRRLTWDDIKTKCRDEKEATDTGTAIIRLRELLAEFGYSIR